MLAKLVVIINGPGGSGKDTFIEICRELLAPRQIPVHSFSAVDQVKEWAKVMGWDGAKDEAGRKLLYDIKMASARYNNGPTKYLLKSVKGIETGLIFLHIREPQEIAKLAAQLPQVLKLHIMREGAAVLANGADNVTLESSYDYYIDNNGTLDDLQFRAQQFLSTL